MQEVLVKNLFNLYLGLCGILYFDTTPLLIVMIMNCVCGMINRRKVFSLISSWDHCQRSSTSRISNTTWIGFKPFQNLSSGLVEWSCTVVITTTPRRHICHIKYLGENLLPLLKNIPRCLLNFIKVLLVDYVGNFLL